MTAFHWSLGCECTRHQTRDTPTTGGWSPPIRATPKRFENFEPDQAEEIPVAEYLLQRAVIARGRGEQQLLDTVIAARMAGVSWQRIGVILGTSAQAAQQRYGIVVDAT